MPVIVTTYGPQELREFRVSEGTQWVTDSDGNLLVLDESQKEVAILAKNYWASAEVRAEGKP